MDRFIEGGHNKITIIELTLAEKTLEESKIIEVKISEVDIEVTIEMKTLEEVEVGLEKDSIQLFFRKNDQSSSSSRSGLRPSTNRDRIRCFKCREYDHLLKTVQTRIQKKNRHNRYNKCN